MRNVADTSIGASGAGLNDRASVVV